jgi:hypothetical protein
MYMRPLSVWALELAYKNHQASPHREPMGLLSRQ